MKQVLCLILVVTLLEGCVATKAPTPVSSLPIMPLANGTITPNAEVTVTEEVVGTNSTHIMYDHIMDFRVSEYTGSNADSFILDYSTNLITWIALTNFPMNPSKWTNGGNVTFHYPSTSSNLFFRTRIKY